MIDWKSQKKLFAWDGTWRDLYILNTEVHDWQRLLDHLHKNTDQLTFTIDGTPLALPSTMDAIFAVYEYASPLLCITLDHVQVNCHFFCAEQIEFDIDPRDITDADTFALVLNFMADVGKTLSKEVRLTPENMQEYVLLRYNPTTRQIEAV
jgi:hypothetical protein